MTAKDTAVEQTSIDHRTWCSNEPESLNYVQSDDVAHEISLIDTRTVIFIITFESISIELASRKLNDCAPSFTIEKRLTRNKDVSTINDYAIRFDEKQLTPTRVNKTFCTCKLELGTNLGIKSTAKI